MTKKIVRRKPKDTTGHISFHIKVNMDGEDVVNIKDDVKLAYFTEKSHLPMSELNFKNIFNSMVISPVEGRVMMKIRDLLEEELRTKAQEGIEDESSRPKDIFIENKKAKQLNDKQEEGSDGNTSEEGKQGDTKKESEEGEWDAPDPISG